MTWTQVNPVDWECNECGAQYKWDEEPKKCEACERRKVILAKLKEIIERIGERIVEARNRIPLPFKSADRLKRLRMYYEITLAHHERDSTEKNLIDPKTQKLIDEYEDAEFPVQASSFTEWQLLEDDLTVY